MAQNFTVPVGLYAAASNPTVPTPAAGDIYYNNSANEIRVYNGSTWVAVGGGAAAPAGTLTGTTLASNVVNSSLTSVGTLTSLTTGTITANAGGGWSGSNLGKQLYITTPTNASNPAIAIADAANTNLWAIYNGSGTFNLATAPAYSDSTTAPAVRFAISSTGKIGLGTTSFPADPYRVNIGGALQVTQATDITPGASGSGQITIGGNGYSGFLSLDATTMWVGHNSGARTLTLATDETARLTISEVGAVNIPGTLSVASVPVVTTTATQTLTNKTFGGATFNSTGKTLVTMPANSITNATDINNLQIINASNAVGNDSFITFHNQGTYAINFGLSRSTNRLMWGGWSAGSNQYQIYSSADLLPNSALQNSSITINGSAVSLGGSITVSGGAASATVLGSVYGYTNSGGQNNSAGLGYGVGNNFGGGYGNMAMGLRACQSLSLQYGGSTNTIIGYDNSARSITGFSNNTMIGRDIAGYGSGGFFNNVVVGYAISISTGSQNVFVGDGAGNSVSSGSQNTYVGYGAANTGSMWQTTGSNNIIIGYNATGTTNGISNQITWGNSSISGLRCQVTSISSLSDIRDKTDVATSTLGLDFINKVRPVTFTWNMRDGGKVGQKELGFIAQELLEIEEEAGLRDYTQIVDTDNPEKLEAAPNKMFPIVIKAIQELSAKIIELEKQLEEAKR